MKKPTKPTKPTKPANRIDIAAISIDDAPYTPPDKGFPSKYEAIFSAYQRGQRIKCPKGSSASSIALLFKRWLKRHGLGGDSPDVRARSDCGDGYGGIWWMPLGTPPPKTQAALPKTRWAPLQGNAARFNPKEALKGQVTPRAHKLNRARAQSG